MVCTGEEMLQHCLEEPSTLLKRFNLHDYILYGTYLFTIYISALIVMTAMILAFSTYSLDKCNLLAVGSWSSEIVFFSFTKNVTGCDRLMLLTINKAYHITSIGIVPLSMNYRSMRDKHCDDEPFTGISFRH